MLPLSHVPYADLLKAKDTQLIALENELNLVRDQKQKEADACFICQDGQRLYSFADILFRQTGYLLQLPFEQLPHTFTQSELLDCPNLKVAFDLQHYPKKVVLAWLEYDENLALLKEDVHSRFDSLNDDELLQLYALAQQLPHVDLQYAILDVFHSTVLSHESLLKMMKSGHEPLVAVACKRAAIHFPSFKQHPDYSNLSQELQDEICKNIINDTQALIKSSSEKQLEFIWRVNLPQDLTGTEITTSPVHVGTECWNLRLDLSSPHDLMLTIDKLFPKQPKFEPNSENASFEASFKCDDLVYSNRELPPCRMEEIDTHDEQGTCIKRISFLFSKELVKQKLHSENATFHILAR